MNHLEKLVEDFNVRFEDLEKIQIPDWIVAPFEITITNTMQDSDLLDELIHMSVDLEAETLFKNNGLGSFWVNVNILNKYPKLCGKVLPFLLAFPCSYLVETGFSHANALLTKERNNLNLEERGDLRLKLTNLTPNINAISKRHQAHPSH